MIKNVMTGMMSLIAMLTIVSCGSSGGSSSGNQTAITPGTCQAGYTWTQQYGCLPQGNCQYGMGSYNGQCVQGQISGYGNGYGNCQAGYVYSQQYGCLPQNNCPMNYGWNGSSCIYCQSSNYGGYGPGGQVPYYSYYPYYRTYGSGWYWYWKTDRKAGKHRLD